MKHTFEFMVKTKIIGANEGKEMKVIEMLNKDLALSEMATKKKKLLTRLKEKCCNKSNNKLTDQEESSDDEEQLDDLALKLNRHLAAE